MLSDITHCDFCRRAEVDQCFMMQINSVCTYYMSLCNLCDQCTAELLIITVSISERSDVVVLCIHIYNDKGNDSTL